MLVLGVAYKPDIGDMRESPALKLIELLRNAGAERLLPRPARPGVPELGLRVGAARAGAVRLRRDRDRPLRRSTTRTLVERRALIVDLRNATGDEGPATATRSGSCDASGSRWPGSATGARTSSATSTTSPTSSRSATSPRAARGVRAPLPDARDDGRLRRDARRPRARGRRDRDAGADALRAREAGAAGGQARLRREAAGDARRRDGGARRARRGARPRR